MLGVSGCNRGRHAHDTFGSLMDLLRVLPAGAEPTQTALSAMDLSGLATVAATHGLAAFIYDQVSPVSGALPAEVELELRRNAMGTVATGMRVRSLALQALRALGNEGITPVLLKGVGLADRIYPNPACRATSDVDLLVLPEAVERSVRALESLSLQPKIESDEYYPPEFRYHLSYVGAPGLVELHFRAMSVFGRIWGAEEFIARSVLSEFGGMPVRYLRPEDELVYLAVHAANHMLQRIGWLLDVKLFISRYPGLDWGEVIALASRTRTRTLLYLALTTSRELVGAAVPPEVVKALRPPPHKRWIIECAFSEERLLRTYLLEHKAIWALTKIAISDDLSSMLRFSAARLRWWLSDPRAPLA